MKVKFVLRSFHSLLDLDQNLEEKPSYKVTTRSLKLDF